MSEIGHASMPTVEKVAHTDPSPATPVRSTVLLVDDEPNVLAGLTLHLRRHYEVITAPNGAAALGLIVNRTPPAVVISDMNMPGIDGALFLATVRKVDPSIVRVLLTGQANVQSAISAINDGQVFRFLTKPCSPTLLLSTVEAGVAQHELLNAERVLLQETLHGSIEALSEVLSLTNPVAFGWALKVKRLVTELAPATKVANVWQVEIAAMFSQLGHVTLPAEVAEKLYYGRPLTDDELAMVSRVPSVTDRLVGHIPRLQVIRDILGRVARMSDSAQILHDEVTDEVRASSQLLDLAIRYMQLESRGHTPEESVSLLRARTGWYPPATLDALQASRCGDSMIAELLEIPVARLHPGMVLAEDMKMVTGQLLAPRGYIVTDSFVERCRNARAGTIMEPVRVEGTHRVAA